MSVNATDMTYPKPPLGRTLEIHISLNNLSKLFVVWFSLLLQIGAIFVSTKLDRINVNRGSYYKLMNKHVYSGRTIFIKIIDHIYEF